MTQIEEIKVQQGLWIDKYWLEKAGLDEKVNIIIKDREIHIVSVEKTSSNNYQKQPKAGLHLGAIWTSDDFDEPLSDGFWLGEEA
jgi:hypothetical protein